jgi:hypothetical protein
MKGKQTTTQTQALTPEAKEEYKRAKGIGEVGTPMYYGPEFAAINEAELAARENVNQMASAFGLQGAGSLSIGAPTATQGGVTGYTTYQGGQAALDMLKRFEPGRYKALMDMMIDPVTGETVAEREKRENPAPGNIFLNSVREYGGYADDRDSVSSAMGTNAGYTSFGDMFDGGGPGQSGPEFGGLLGGVSNSLGITPSDFGYGDDD